MNFTVRFDAVHREDILIRSSRYIWKPGGRDGLNYLREVRKLSDDIIRDFQLGYIPPEVNHQLAGRIIIPIYDASNHLVALSSRSIFNNINFLPTYWHEKYEKSMFLFGLNLAKSEMRTKRFCIVVEGQFDAMQMFNHGFRNTVAVCGSKLSKWQVALMCRYCPYILIIFDKDKNLTGQKAAEKGLKELATTTLNNKSTEHEYNYCPGYVIDAVQLPEFCDPDEYLIRNNTDSLKILIDQKIKMLMESYDAYIK